jgi:hypothetical protein
MEEFLKQTSRVGKSKNQNGDMRVRVNRTVVFAGFVKIHVSLPA